jgi:hypothetical protein
MTTEPFGKQKISRLVTHLKDGAMEPRDAEVVVGQFCECDPNQVPRAYIEYLQEGFRQYLAGKKLALSLGLEHSRGRPSVSQELKESMAYQILLRRLAGATYERACNDVAADFYKEASAMRAAWRKHSLYALDMVVAVRHLTGQLWTVEESARLRKIFKSAASRVETLQLNMAFVPTDD